MRANGEGKATVLSPIDRFRQGDHVITPRRDEAVVVRTVGQHVDLVYVDPLPGAEAEVTIHCRLLTKFVPGLKLPAPIRVDADGRRVPSLPGKRR